MEWLNTNTELSLPKTLQDCKDNNDKCNLHVLRDALIQQYKRYKDETVKMEEVRKKLQLLKHELNPYTQSELDKLTSLQQNFETKQCNVESIGLCHADRMCKENNYATEITTCNKIYHNLIEKLCREIKTAKGELERSENKVTDIITVSNEDVKKLHVKIELHAKGILKYQEKYSWLSDPQFNLQNFSKASETLLTLRNEKAKLTEELSVYQGLNPDINEATQQLADLKNEYDSML